MITHETESTMDAREQAKAEGRAVTEVQKERDILASPQSQPKIFEDIPAEEADLERRRIALAEKKHRAFEIAEGGQAHKRRVAKLQERIDTAARQRGEIEASVAALNVKLSEDVGLLVRNHELVNAVNNLTLLENAARRMPGLIKGIKGELAQAEKELAEFCQEHGIKL